MSGPLGGHQGYTKTFGPAGRGKKRFVTKGFKLPVCKRICRAARAEAIVDFGFQWPVASRGSDVARACLLRLGSYVIIKYKLGHETFIEYEGKIVDKRVGSEDKESYVELKDCLTLNPDGKILAIDKLKRLTDSFIEDWAACAPLSCVLLQGSSLKSFGRCFHHAACWCQGYFLNGMAWLPGMPLCGEARNNTSSGSYARWRGKPGGPRSVGGGSSWHADARNDAHDAWDDDAIDDDASRPDTWCHANDARRHANDAHDDSGHGRRSGRSRSPRKCAKQK